MYPTRFESCNVTVARPCFKKRPVIPTCNLWFCFSSTVSESLSTKKRPLNGRTWHEKWVSMWKYNVFFRPYATCLYITQAQQRCSKSMADVYTHTHTRVSLWIAVWCRKSVWFMGTATVYFSVPEREGALLLGRY